MKKLKLKKDDYLKLVGLLALAPQHNKALKDIEAAICDIVKVEKPNEGGHCGDAVYSEYSADELLEKLAYAEERKAKAKRSSYR